MKKGRLIRKESPQELIAGLDGMVYTVRTTGREAKHLEQECLVSNVNVTEKGFEVRIVGESLVPLRFRRQVTPTLEDVYLYWMEEEQD